MELDSLGRISMLRNHLHHIAAEDGHGPYITGGWDGDGNGQVGARSCSICTFYWTRGKLPFQLKDQKYVVMR